MSLVEGTNQRGLILARIPLRDQAVEVLRDLIIRGDLKAGTRLNEVELATKLGISRGPIREAIQRLAAEGVVEFQQNKGAFVKRSSHEDLRQMFEVRELIEVKAAMLAATRATDEQIIGLQTLLETVDEELARSETGSYPIEQELDLHLHVLELAGNPYLQRAGSDLQTQVRVARVRSGSSPERAQLALEEHREIISAIAERNAKAAARAMSKHLAGFLAQLSAIENEVGADGT
jgi:DNA-binding GntR family transcriptional regulator